MNHFQEAEINWEWSVIASAINDPASMQAAEELLPSDFTRANQIVWAELLNLRARYALDLRSIGNALENCQDWARISPEESPAQYLARVMTFRGDNMPAYVAAVLDRSTRRKLRTYAALIAQEAEDTGRPMDQVLDEAENRILALRRNRGGTDLSMADIMAFFLPRFEGMANGSIRPNWSPEVQAIRDIVDYLEDTDFMVCAARPGEGKSSWMRYEFYQAAKKGRSVAILNYENDPMEYVRYFLAIETGIDSKKIRHPRLLSEEEKLRLRQAAQQIAALPIRVVTTERNVNAAVAKARKLVVQDQVTLIGLDYIGLLNNGIENRVNDVSLTTGKLRAFALDYKVPVIANCQLNRDIERRGADSEPRLDDLRESGSIEQDATLVMFPRPVRSPSVAMLEMFPENYDDVTGRLLNNRPRALPVLFHILKNRNGTTGVSDPVKWCKHLGTYHTLTRDAAEGRR